MTPKEFLLRRIISAFDWLDRRRVVLPADLYIWRAGNAEHFAAKAPAKPAPSAAVSDYQKALDDAYSAWARDTADKLDKAKDTKDRDRIIAAALALLLVTLQKLGQDNLPDAVEYGLDGTETDDEIDALLEDAIAENDDYIAKSLIPDIGTKLRAGLIDLDALDVAGKLGAGAFLAGLQDLLGTVSARVSSYAGAWWALVNRVRGMVKGKSNAIYWYLDPAVKEHCPDCLEYGSEQGTKYESMADLLEKTGGLTPAHGVQCGGNCRCSLLLE